MNHLEEHKIVERRQDPTDRRVVLVDYAPGMQNIARRMMEGRRRLGEAVNALTDDEARAFLKGLRSRVESFDTTKEEAVEQHR